MSKMKKVVKGDVFMYLSSGETVIPPLPNTAVLKVDPKYIAHLSPKVHGLLLPPGGDIVEILEVTNDTDLTVRLIQPNISVTVAAESVVIPLKEARYFK